jgi:hypothetical protein
MSGLSARTYSCGGDAGRLGGGGVSFLKYFVIGALASYANDMDSSSVGGADDRDEESEKDMVSGGGRGVCVVGCRSLLGCEEVGVGVAGRILSTAPITTTRARHLSTAPIYL